MQDQDTTRRSWISLGIGVGICVMAIDAHAVTPATPTFPTSLPDTSAARSAGTVSAPPELSIFYMVDVDGRLAMFNCREGSKPPPDMTPLDYANTVAALERAREESRERGELEPLTLVGGDVVSPGVLARSVLSRPDGAEELMTLLDRSRLDHLTLGNHEFDVTTDVLQAVLAAAEKRGILTHIANADCDVEKTGLCKYLGDEEGRVPRRYRIFERGEVRIAVISVLDDDLPRRVTPGRTAGLTFRNPADVARELIHGIRKRGEADVVVLVAHLEHSSTSPRHVLEFARSLIGSEQPDLIIANGLHGETSREGTIEVIRLSEGLPPIVGTRRYPTEPGRVRLRIEPPAEPGGRAVVTVLEIGDLDISASVFDAGLRGRFRADAERYCADAGTPIGKGRLAKPMSADAFTFYSLEVMRRTASAEVAFVNTGVVDAGAGFPIADYVSRDDLTRALPYDANLVVARVKGDELIRFFKSRWKWREIRDPEGLRIIGPTTTNGKVFKINGRPLYADVPYRVVTIDFVAAGGDGILEGFAGAKWKWKPYLKKKESVGIRDLMIRYFEGELRTRAFETSVAIDLEANFKPLEDRMLWDLRFDVNGGVTDVTIRSSLSDDQTSATPQLARGQLTSMVADLTFGLFANNSSHAFDFILSYSFGWATPDLFGDPSNSEVTTDLLTTETIYRFRLFKKAVGRDKWYVPEPYLATFVESELIRAPRDETTGDRLPIQRTFTATVGYRFRLLPKLELKLGAGAKSTGGGFLGNPPVVVVELGFRLQKYKLGAPLNVPIFLQTELSVFTGERYETPGKLETEARFAATLYFSLGFNLFFTLTHNVFALSLFDFRSDIGKRSTVGFASELIGAIRMDLDFRAMAYD